MNLRNLLPQEHARLCAGIVREVSNARGVSKDPIAVASLTMTVAKLYNSGLHCREELLSAAMRAVDAPPGTAANGKSELQHTQFAER